MQLHDRLKFKPENKKTITICEVTISYIAVVRRGNNIFQLLGSEDVNSNKVTLSMTVLPSLGGGNFYNLEHATQQQSS